MHPVYLWQSDTERSVFSVTGNDHTILRPGTKFLANFGAGKISNQKR